jgi:hypothetical protein
MEGRRRECGGGGSLLYVKLGRNQRESIWFLLSSGFQKVFLEI